MGDIARKRSQPITCIRGYYIWLAVYTERADTVGIIRSNSRFAPNNPIRAMSEGSLGTM